MMSIATKMTPTEIPAMAPVESPVDVVPVCTCMSACVHWVP